MCPPQTHPQSILRYENEDKLGQTPQENRPPHTRRPDSQDHEGRHWHILWYMQYAAHTGLYEILFYVEAFVHESVALLLPPPTCIARSTAILLHMSCAIYDAPPTPRLYALHNTILVMAISCKGQRTHRKEPRTNRPTPQSTCNSVNKNSSRRQRAESQWRNFRARQRAPPAMHKRSKSNGTTQGFTIGSPFGIMFFFSQPSNGTGSSLSISKAISAVTVHRRSRVTPCGTRASAQSTNASGAHGQHPSHNKTK